MQVELLKISDNNTFCARTRYLINVQIVCVAESQRTQRYMFFFALTVLRLLVIGIHILVPAVCKK